MSVLLSNGMQMPAMGFGSYDIKVPEDLITLKQAIIKHGFRHIDTAEYYKNEVEIGEVLNDIFKTTDIKRGDIFITTKVFYNNVQDIEGALKASLQRLNLDYVDLYLLHWPFNVEGTYPDYTTGKVPVHVQWKEMEKLVELGLAKSIGVSNYNFQLLNDLLTYAKIKPVCNQIELHPYLNQIPLVEWLKNQNIVPIAYCPLAKGRSILGEDCLLNNHVIRKLAEKYESTPGQIALAWGLARGHVVIPKTSNEKRAIENFKSQDVKLSENDIAEINTLDRNLRICDPLKWGKTVRFPVFC